MAALNVFSHHKCATRWLLHYLTRVSELNGLRLYHTDFGDDVAPTEADIAFFGNSQYETVNANTGAGIHVIRNPLSVIVSAYYSHLKTHPSDGWPELNAQRRLLEAHDKYEGMFLTLTFLERTDIAQRAIGPLLAMREWDYEDDKYQTIRAEDAVTSPYALLSPSIRAALPGVDLNFPGDQEFEFANFAGGRPVGQRDNGSHYRSGAPDDWRQELPAAVIAYVRERFSDVLSSFYPDAVTDNQDVAPDIARRRKSVREQITDRERWEDPTSYEAFWSKRAEAAAALARKGERICDIGCGARQSLGAVLPRGTEYFPADLKSWAPNVMECDLNAGLLPTAYLRRCHVAYLLGVIEYISDLPGLFAALARETEFIVVSYNCADFVQADRTGYGWINALTSAELRTLLSDAGFEVEETKHIETKEIVIRARSRQYGWWKRISRHKLRQA